MIRQLESKDKPEYLQSINNNSKDQNRWHNYSPHKTSMKKLFPQYKQGYSYEAPTNFIQKQSFYNEKTYKNLYINNNNNLEIISQPKLLQSISNNQQYSLDNKITIKYQQAMQNVQNNINDNFQQTIKVYDPVIDKTKEMKLNKENKKPIDEFKQLHKLKLKDDGFNRKLGLFSDYVKQNNILNVYGPLLTNKRGFRRDPQVYAFENEKGCKIARMSMLKTFVNKKVLEQYQITANSVNNNLRTTQSSYMTRVKNEEKIKSLEKNQIISTIKQIKDEINRQNSVISDSENYSLCKDKEIQKQNILVRINQKGKSKYFDEERQRTHNLYYEDNNYIESFEKNNQLLFKKPYSAQKNNVDTTLNSLQNNSQKNSKLIIQTHNI